MKYSISRYEEKSDQLFICINHTEKPVYIEWFFTEDERKDEKSRIATIEKLVAKLQIKADEYVEPEAWVSRLEEAKALKLDSDKIATAKAELLLVKEVEAELLLAKEVEDDETK
jgi:hypothetical protein